MSGGSYRTNTDSQYRATLQSIMDTRDEARDGATSGQQLQIEATLAVALSNLAVAEAIHQFRESIEGDWQALIEALAKERPIVVNTTGEVTLDPEATAEAINRILRSKP